MRQIKRHELVKEAQFGLGGVRSVPGADGSAEEI
jgi:hypothetical protein